MKSFSYALPTSAVPLSPPLPLPLPLARAAVRRQQPLVPLDQAPRRERLVGQRCRADLLAPPARHARVRVQPVLPRQVRRLLHPQRELLLVEVVRGHQLLDVHARQLAPRLELLEEHVRGHRQEVDELRERDGGDPAQRRDRVRPPQREMDRPPRALRHPLEQEAEGVADGGEPRPAVADHRHAQSLGEEARQHQQPDQQQREGVGERRLQRLGPAHGAAPRRHADADEDQHAGQLGGRGEQDVDPAAEQRRAEVDVQRHDGGDEDEHREGVEDQAVEDPGQPGVAHLPLQHDLLEQQDETLAPVAEPLRVGLAPAPERDAPVDAPAEHGQGDAEQHVHHPGVGDVPHQGPRGLREVGHGSLRLPPIPGTGVAGQMLTGRRLRNTKFSRDGLCTSTACACSSTAGLHTAWPSGL